MPTGSEASDSASTQNSLATQPSVITVPVNIPLSEKLDLSGSNLPVKWQRFSRVWSNYEIAVQLKDPKNQDWNKKRRTPRLLTCIGSDSLDVIDAMKSEIKDQRKTQQ